MTQTQTQPRYDWQLHNTVRTLKAGGVVAYPTEAVWGLGCRWQDIAAIERILALKQRPQHKGMIVLCADLDQLEAWLVPLTPVQRQQICAPQARPTTWLLPCLVRVPRQVRGRHHTLAVRITQQPRLRALCQAAGPLISTSANPAGRVPATSALQVRGYFKQLDALLPGALGGYRQPSQIRTLLGQRVR